MDTEEYRFSKGFDDIEMMEVGDTSSEAESISKSSIPSTIDSDVSDAPVLKEWLHSDKPLSFHFNSSKYQSSLTLGEDVFHQVYTKYVNKSYKIIEELRDTDLRSLDYSVEEPIGLITSGTTASKEELAKKKDDEINEAFFQLIEQTVVLVDELKEMDHDELDNYECVLSILDCLLAVCFTRDTNLKPLKLTKWVNRFNPRPEQELVEEIMFKSSKSYLHPLFWNKFISTLLIRGLLDQAVNSLLSSGFQELKESEYELFQVIEDLINLLESYNSMALKNEFSEWKLSCCEFRDSFSSIKPTIQSPENILILDQIHDILCILTGLPKTIAAYCETWYEVVTALSLYQIRDDESLYSEYFDVAIKETPPMLLEGFEQDLFKSTESAFLNTFEGNYLKVLMTLNVLDPASAAFVSRFLEIKGLLASYYSVETSRSFEDSINNRTISEYLLTQFSFHCLNNHDLVPVGIGLLVNKEIVNPKETQHNRTIIESFLPKYNCITNDDLDWCLTVCAKLGLVTTASELYRIHGNKSLKEGMLYEALNMLANCINDDSDKKGIKEIYHIVWDMIFQDSLLNNRPANDVFINDVVRHKVNFEINPVIKQCLSPYGVLHDYYQSLTNIANETKIPVNSKISRIIHLLEFMYLPKKFYPLLLAQFVPFFINDKFQFQTPDLIIIIELIDNFEANVSKNDKDKAQQLYTYSIENFEDNISDYDWRMIVKEKGIDIPTKVEDLIHLLRNQVVDKSGQAYLGSI